MMKPVIFLDFDGVLNSTRSRMAMGGTNRRQLDPVAVKLVGRLVRGSGARVVVSSAWRIGSSVAELREILGFYCQTTAEAVIDVTPQFGECRGAEIARWMAENPDKHNRQYVIIDDDSDMLDGQLPHFVQTSHRDGFGVPEYLRALEIIAPNHKDVTQLAWYAKDNPLKHQHPKLEWEQ